jgi:hypothetical protein
MKLSSNIILLLLVFSLGCQEKAKSNFKYIVRADIKFMDDLFSIHIDESGNTYVIRSITSKPENEIIVSHLDTSQYFKLDSFSVFFEKIERLESVPVFKEQRNGVAQRAEVYYNGKKIFDTYAWDRDFWDLFLPIMTQIPDGYNPFRVSNLIEPRS